MNPEVETKKSWQRCMEINAIIAGLRIEKESLLKDAIHELREMNYTLDQCKAMLKMGKSKAIRKSRMFRG